MRAEKRIQKMGVIPVVTIEDKKYAEPLAEALVHGGLPCAEVTFRTEAAEESIKKMAKKYPEMLLGAGTILTVEQAECAVAAGAQFLVSPGFDQEVVDFCVTNKILIFPGCVTPTEISSALKCGLKIIKFFPAESFGGPVTIKAIASAYTDLKFMPTGGIHMENLSDYLRLDRVIACGGSWMVNASLIREGKFEEIRQKTEEAVELVRRIRRS